ncbi:helix-turn-helix domain-containing protein [Pandoraea apista]|uniref:helix-turn-helix domain-containing protein n=1 Tax=Pandoraea apista TaxID=93218 RepID=UPI00065A77FA|nr:helix-turn-helix domain-containing protein [Pandoraea apista]AVF39421.1 AraC family transcriptional regulator [Pandoraea apista]RRW97838.1 AraC family transcriptional regulator [Pandoraea apista]RRX07030.1 AraC family transcriptional regulator [Pandoraea apista]CFB62472.1 Helix-turn-helix domain protein [Pandoraea apista]
MRITHRRPAAALQATIDRYWGWDTRSASGANSALALPMMPLLPGPGGMEVFFHFGQSFTTGTGQRLPGVHITCLRGTTAALDAPAGLDFVAVRIKSGEIPSLTDVPVCELADTFISATELWGTAVNELYESMAHATTFDARAARLDRFFLKRLRHAPPGRDIRPAIARLHSGQTRIEDLCAVTQLGRRQLEVRFRQTTGSSPVRFRRLARLRRSLRTLLLAPQDCTLTQLLDAGYVDQAQQVHEFRDLTGHTPSQLRRAALAGDAHFYNPSWASDPILGVPRPMNGVRR